MGTMEQRMEGVVELILQDYAHQRDIDRLEPHRQPDKDVVTDLVHKLQRIVYPGYFRDNRYSIYHMKHNLSMLIEDVAFHLSRQIGIVLQADPCCGELTEGEVESRAQELTLSFFDRLPAVRALAQSDVQAAYDGDPAACSKEEIIFSYPGIFAVTVQRLAHELFLLGVPMLPRIMTEYAHSVTGIDIHPGASIGDHFFIDHGTGVVIGETTVIGSFVKVYQGVTLGGLSTRGGQSLRGAKRHPTIEDRVTIYAGASILGGETVIGEGSVIGSNAFITASVAPNSRISRSLSSQ